MQANFSSSGRLSAPLSMTLDLAIENSITFMTTVTGAKACFVAGTLVHTPNGLVPIEALRAGDMVLSQPEGKGELAYKPIVKIFTLEDKPVVLLRFARIGEDVKEKLDHLVATENHLFYVKGKGWTRMGWVEPGDELELHDGSRGIAWHLMNVLKTETKDVGFVQYKTEDLGHTVDFRVGSSLLSTERSSNLRAEDEFIYLKRPVFNIEVDVFNTYYVGELGVWVCNADCIDQGGA